MSCTKKTVLMLVVFILVSVLVARIQDAIEVKEPWMVRPETASMDVVLDDRYRHLMHFVQVTDTHLSVLSDPERAVDLKEFIRDTIMNVIKPPVVVMTGDIADSVRPGFLQSGQQREEWQLYWRAIYETGVTRQLAWLDIRGNHDNLNLASFESDHNFYRVYSVRGRVHPHSYSYTHREGADTYSFIAIDTCTDPGIKRPFNFVGSLPEDQLSALLEMKEESRRSNFTVWFGHHPTSSVASVEIRELMRHSGPYLCGHFHTFGGLFRELYLLQPTGALELELADWKHGRTYRLAAVDHGLFSFVDVTYRQWPIILVTNPKSALLSMPSIEPLGRIARSTHVRVLVFSPEPVARARFSVDGGEWASLRHVNGSPLWVAPWAPQRFTNGLHELHVQVADANGTVLAEHRTEFSLDGARPVFSLAIRLLLQGGISALQALFGLLVCACLLPLCWFKLVQASCEGRLGRGSAGGCRACCSGFALRMHLLVSVDVLFWPLLLFPVYVAVGPWFVGELVDGHYGVCFLWGTYLRGRLLPSGLSYLFATAFLLFCYVPLVVVLTHALWRRRLALTTGAPMASSFWLALVLALQWTWSAPYIVAYGYLALLLGFLCTGAPLASLVAWRVARTLPHHRMETFERLLGSSRLDLGPTKAGSS